MIRDHARLTRAHASATFAQIKSGLRSKFLGEKRQGLGEAETPPRVALRPERTELEARAEKRIALFVVFA